MQENINKVPLIKECMYANQLKKLLRSQTKHSVLLDTPLHSQLISTFNTYFVRFTLCIYN